MSDFLFRGSLLDLDPAVHDLSAFETERQVRKLILIPSESTAPVAVREALSSPLQNIYAEGYPDEETRRLTEAEILDLEMRLGEYRRLSDPRYYKGVEYADAVEALARRRCAEVFAANGRSADDLFVNVQALSGAPANNAVYHALVQPGDTVMGMNLLHGGHLTHGSPVNRSGKYYHIVHYTVDPQTEQIDYDAVAALALEHKPKMIIAGYSSYSWLPDWQRFRQIADSVGAYLMADIAHIAGMIAAGVLASPVGIADVVTFTTHKSLCGPRGAAIVTHQRKLARLIDRAVFPGEQGGPHVNTMAAQAVTFRLAATDQFKKLQRQIITNSAALNDALAKSGFRIPFGGTNTHLTNLDVRSVRGPDGTPLNGDNAARILDLAGIVVNRNTIPGDVSAANPSGIRLGTPWITQRGFTPADCETLAGHLARLLQACVPYDQPSPKGPIHRAKVPFDVLDATRLAVRDMAASHGVDVEPARHGYPHFFYSDDPAPRGKFGVIGLGGEHAEGLLRWATSSRPESLAPGGVVKTSLVVSGRAIAGTLARSGATEWALTLPSADVPLALQWLRDLSDGFVMVDPEDRMRRFPGPVAVRLQGDAAALPKASDASADDKPWFLGVPAGEGKPLPVFTWTEPADPPIKRTALFETHKAMGAKMVPFAGWEMPVWYTSVIEEHLATRNAAGLFDVSHMGVYQAEGPQACGFLDGLVTNDIAALAVGESLYTQFLDANGQAIDDTMIYRRGPEIYLVVVNASNDDKDWAWLNGVREGKLRVDNRRPWAKAFGLGCRLRNLRDPKEGDDMRVDIALQGPRSREILLALGCDDAARKRIEALPWAGITQGVFGGIDLVVSRTGYTGERVAFELFVHPKNSEKLWKALVKVGEPMGLKPIGLGARDSLRTEAGLPLYGHEMAGEHGLSVGQSGFGAYVKPHKPWFVGREAFMAQEASRDGMVTRFRFDEKGVRMAHGGDPVVDRKGRVIGFVTSCAVDKEGYLLGQAYLQTKYLAEGTPIAVYQGSPKDAGPAPAALKPGDKVTLPTPATVLTRFPR
jgi:glycine hydroxymethyltransferase